MCFKMKIILFARILGSTQLCKISQNSGLLSNFGSLPKIRNARSGCCHPLWVNMNWETWFYHDDFLAHPARSSEIYFDFCSCPLPFHNAILLVALIF